MDARKKSSNPSRTQARGQRNAITVTGGGGDGTTVVAAANCEQSFYVTAYAAEGYFTLFTLQPAH